MTKMALLPVEPTEEMMEAFYLGAQAAMDKSFAGQKQPYGIAPAEWFPPAYASLITASPTSGRVSRADLERAAERAAHEIDVTEMLLTDPMTLRRLKAMRVAKAIIAALGLSLEPGIQDEGGVE